MNKVPHTNLFLGGSKISYKSYQTGNPECEKPLEMNKKVFFDIMKTRRTIIGTCIVRADFERLSAQIGSPSKFQIN